MQVRKLLGGGALIATALLLSAHISLAATFTTPLTLGDKGAEVTDLQTLLISQGLLPSDDATGYYGPLTFAAVKSLQSSHGLETVGSVGPQTRTLLNTLSSSAHASSLSATQVQAILSLLTSFGVDQATITTVSNILSGIPIAATIASTATTTASTATSTCSVSSCVPGTSIPQPVSPGNGYTPGFGGGGSAPTPSPTCTMSASPASIAIGSSTSLTWSSSNGSSASLNQSIGSVGTAGSQSVSPVTNTTYTLTVTNSAGSTATCGATVSASDMTAPTTPTNLTAVAASLSELDLSWTAATDNVGVAGYKILRGGVYVGTTTTGTTFADTGLAASTTYTYTVKAYDAAGNVSTASNIGTSTTGTWADGFAAAPTGTVQQPNLLQGYIARAPWHVAGVDYHVGITSGTTLTPAATYASANPTYLSISGTTFRCDNASSITINGVDFTGYSFYNASCGSLTITNSKFACPSSWSSSAPYTFFHDQAGGADTLNDDEWYGENCGTWPNDVSDPVAPGSSLVFQYNYMEQMPERHVSGAPSTNYRYNFIYNPNTQNGAHENMQQFGYTGTTTQDLVEFNTTYTASSTYGAEGFQFYNNTAGQEFDSPTLQYNTMIAKQLGGQNTMTYMIHGQCQSGSTLCATYTGTPLDRYNYFDSSGAYGPYYDAMTAWTNTGNIDMSTGATITP